VTLSPGKQKGLAALSTDRGIIAALAIDQRSALRKLFAKAVGRAADEIPAICLPISNLTSAGFSRPTLAPFSSTQN